MVQTIEFGDSLLMEGCCLERMSEIPDGSIDMVLSDVPYGTTRCKWDSVIPFIPMWMQLKRVIKSNGVIVLTAGQPFTSFLIASNPEMFRYCWIWQKNKSTNFLNAKHQPLRSYEDIAVFYSKKPSYHPQKSFGHKPVNSFTKHTSDGETLGKTRTGISGGGQTDRYPTNIIKVDVVNNDNSGEEKYIPTQKPVALMEYLIKTYTNDGESVLDFTAGSFTTGHACINLNRKFIGIEKDTTHFNLGLSRLRKHYIG